MLNKKALAATAGGAEPIFIEECFSTTLYTGNGSTQTITNGIDLSGEGGLVWFKYRDYAKNHLLQDTAQGLSNYLSSNLTNAAASAPNAITAFNSNGFTIGGDAWINSTGTYNKFVSWTFRKAEKFFDVVTWTGTGGSGTRAISHNLGSSPGAIFIKKTSASQNWAVYHRSASDMLCLNSTAAAGGVFSGDVSAVSSTTFTVLANTGLNDSSATYVAYLFAHDAGGFGEDGTDNVISCGSFTTDGAGAATVNLGYEPQFVLTKAASTTGSWKIVDTMRGLPASGTNAILYPNLLDSEATDTLANINATGFSVSGQSASATLIYIAIRRGPMKTPELGTSVFTPTVYTGTNVDNRLINTTIAPDFVMIRQRNDTVVPGMYTGARLTGQEFLITGSTNAGATDVDSFDAQIVSTVEYGNAFSSMSGVWVGNDATRKFNENTNSNNHIIEAFKRAPGFFDTVCYTGTGSNRTVSHNLGVVPEMMWIKKRDSSTNAEWQVYAAPIGNGNRLQLNNDTTSTSTTFWNSTTPTSSVFSLGNNSGVNASGSTFIALLFASCAGVSKVGSYTGNGGSEFSDGTSQTIDCGFASSARFVLIKKTNFAGDWYLFDSARGIVTADDPYLLLNSTAAEVTNLNLVDTSSSGFVVNQIGSTNLNVTNHTYIYLAIA